MWFISVTPALSEVEMENQKFKSTISYIVSSSLAWTTRDTISKKLKKKCKPFYYTVKVPTVLEIRKVSYL